MLKVLVPNPQLAWVWERRKVTRSQNQCRQVEAQVKGLRFLFKVKLCTPSALVSEDSEDQVGNPGLYALSTEAFLDP